MKKILLTLLLLSQELCSAPFYQQVLTVSPKLETLGVIADRSPRSFAEHVRAVQFWKGMGMSKTLKSGLWPHPRTVDYDTLSGITGHLVYPASSLSKLISCFFPTQDGFEVNSVANDPIKELSVVKLARMIAAIDKATSDTPIVKTHFDAERLYSSVCRVISSIWSIPENALELHEKNDEDMERELFLRNAEKRITLQYEVSNDNFFGIFGAPMLSVIVNSLKPLPSKQRTYLFMKHLNPSTFEDDPETAAPPVLRSDDFNIFDQPKSSIKETINHKKRCYVRLIAQSVVDAHIDGVLNEQGMPQKVMMAFMAKRFSKPGQLKNFYKSYLGELGQHDQEKELSSLDDGIFAETYTVKWFDETLKQTTDNPAYFWSLPETDRSAFVQLYKPLVYQWVPEIEKSTVVDEHGRKLTFSDCGETALRGFFATLCQKGSRYDGSIFPEGPAQNYFKIYPTKDALDTRKSRDAWAQIISFLPDKHYVNYLNESEYEISPDLLTFHNLLGYLLGKDDAFYQSSPSSPSITENIQGIVSSLYDGSFQVDIFHNFPQSEVTLRQKTAESDKVMGYLHLSPNHAEFYYEKGRDLNPVNQKLLTNSPPKYFSEAVKYTLFFTQSLKSWNTFQDLYKARADISIRDISVDALMMAEQDYFGQNFIPSMFFVPSATPEQIDLCIRCLQGDNGNTVSTVFALQYPGPENTFADATYITPQYERMWLRVMEGADSKSLSFRLRPHIMVEGPSTQPIEDDRDTVVQSLDFHGLVMENSLTQLERHLRRNLTEFPYFNAQSLLPHAHDYTGIRAIPETALRDHTDLVSKLARVDSIAVKDFESIEEFPEKINYILLNGVYGFEDFPTRILRDKSEILLKFLKGNPERQVRGITNYPINEKAEVEEFKDHLQSELAANNIAEWQFAVEYKLSTPCINILEEDVPTIPLTG